MNKYLRRYAVSALAFTAVVGGVAIALPASSTAAAEWKPVPYGLTATPAQLLPANVTTADPVRVVSTSLDSEGRPVVTVHTATDNAGAARLVEKAQQTKNAVGVEVDAPIRALADDTYRAKQWDLTTMNVPAANTRSTGRGAVVAVIDTGVDAAHPDLAGQVLPGMDYITDRAGTSTDPNGHGTHVAGTIAALTGNGIGVASTAPGARILPVRVLDAEGSGYMSDAASGIVWAADHGANVINMSLGSGSRLTAVSNAISYARGKGVTVVAAAGNERAEGSPTSYPAADAGVIAVAATDSADRIASYSNIGSYVDVAAPGSTIFSTFPTALGSYETMYGTSMASPHVAAVAALLESFNPALTPDQVEKAIETSAADLGAAGKDNDYGYGRVDAAAALTAVTPAPTTPATSSPTTAPTTVAPTPSKTTSTAPTTTAPATTAPTSKAPTSTPPTSKTPSPVVKVRPVVKVGAASTEVVYGSTVVTTFTVTASGKAGAKMPMQVCVTETGRAAVCSVDTTAANGTVTVRRVANAGYSVHIVVAATSTSEAVTSSAAAVTVKASVKATRSGGTMTVTLTGVAGQTVVVQQQSGTSWTTVLSYTATAKATVKGLVTGRKYRVLVPATTGIQGATSATV